jgi:hypothetical protein
MIDANREMILTLAQAARELPNRSGGRGVDVTTVWRWTRRGIRDTKLETLLIGRIRYTSREALQRFFEATTRAAEGTTARLRCASHHKRDADELDRSGI